jgi:hypothetical protein
MEIKWIKSKIEGRVGLSVPYNEAFNNVLKAAVPSAKFDYQKGAWFFDEEAKEEVVPFLEQYYINTTLHRVVWDTRSEDNITVDGARLLFVNRDYWKFSRGGPSFKIVEEGLSSGGSRNHPHISGRLVIDIQLREGAVLDPEPESIEEIEDTAEKNPLEAFPTSMLVAELERRGMGEGPAVELVRELLAAVEKQSHAAFEAVVEKARGMADHA